MFVTSLKGQEKKKDDSWSVSRNIVLLVIALKLVISNQLMSFTVSCSAARLYWTYLIKTSFNYLFSLSIYHMLHALFYNINHYDILNLVNVPPSGLNKSLSWFLTLA